MSKEKALSVFPRIEIGGLWLPVDNQHFRPGPAWPQALVNPGGAATSAWPLNVSSCFVSDLDARPWDFQAEECALRANIERFNARRYDRAHSNPDFLPVDNCLQSVLGQRVDLPEDFQMNYDLWLEREVFSKPISWEELLQ